MQLTWSSDVYRTIFWLATVLFFVALADKALNQALAMAIVAVWSDIKYDTIAMIDAMNRGAAGHE